MADKPLAEEIHVQIHSDVANLTSLQALASPGPSPTPATTRAVRAAINAINESELLGFDRELRFSTDPLSKLAYVQVVSRSTGELIVQIPSQFVLDLAQTLQNRN